MLVIARTSVIVFVAAACGGTSTPVVSALDADGRDLSYEAEVAHVAQLEADLTCACVKEPALCREHHKVDESLRLHGLMRDVYPGWASDTVRKNSVDASFDRCWASIASWESDREAACSGITERKPSKPRPNCGAPPRISPPSVAAWWKQPNACPAGATLEVAKNPLDDSKLLSARCVDRRGASDPKYLRSTDWYLTGTPFMDATKGGAASLWAPNGALLVHGAQGIPGPWVHYYPSGRVSDEGQIDEWNRRTGHWTSFWPDGTKRYEGEEDSARASSTGTWFNADGTPERRESEDADAINALPLEMGAAR